MCGSSHWRGICHRFLVFMLNAKDLLKHSLKKKLRICVTRNVFLLEPFIDCSKQNMLALKTCRREDRAPSWFRSRGVSVCLIYCIPLPSCLHTSQNIPSPWAVDTRTAYDISQRELHTHAQNAIIAQETRKAALKRRLLKWSIHLILSRKRHSGSHILQMIKSPLWRGRILLLSTEIRAMSDQQL